MPTTLKLLLAESDLPAFRRLGLLGATTAARPRSMRLHSTYFDSPKCDFRARGMELRMRRQGRWWTETLKAGTAGGPMEWSRRMKGPQPDPAALAPMIRPNSRWGRALNDPVLVETLAPVFDSEIRRTRWLLSTSTGAQVELILDRGELRHGELREPICELELRSDDARAPFDIALQLQQAIPLRVGASSNSERGYRLAEHEIEQGVKAREIRLKPSMSGEEAFRIILRNCLAQMQANESDVIQGSFPESVHQLRVGLRRLRTALGLFAKLVPLPETLERELDWLDEELGAARDADVLASSTLPRILIACPPDPALQALQQTALSLAEQKRRQAALAVSSARYSRLMLRLLAWLEAPREPDVDAPKDLAKPVEKLARRLVAKRHKKLRKRGKGLSSGEPGQRHRLRIAAKKARYTTEFFAALFPARRVTRYRKVLGRLQQKLGGLNDKVVADGLLAEIAKTLPDAAIGSSLARGFLRGRLKQDVDELDALWGRFKCVSNPW